MRPAGSTESSPEARQRSLRHAAASRGRGTRHSEAYGFVGSIAASAAALAYIAWAYAPEPWFCHIGATYYPNKYPASSLRTGEDQAIEPISDIGIDRMNHLMFGEQGFHSLPRGGWTRLNPS
ncbi:phosphatidylinositol N-acetylglucosaminyltransferase subunit P-like [Triticum dicoccoides]|uniref:phosphatidylinositol N-acetylglucosaminyltransferase subunit P-like n=1 Tax=Triticum dicoccoides TaxID=85692 RepID=UPI00188FB2DB|nr:phosphatidylinositol N-acetylglucosaminyltransferase subunit P-like [Triticum dicoccoides]